LPSLSEPPIGDDRTLHDAWAREEALRETLHAISQLQDDETAVFEVILMNAARLCDAPLARLQLVNEARSHFSLVHAWGEELRSFRLGTEWDLNGPQIVPTAIREARTIHVENIADDPLYHQRDPVRVRLVEEEGVRTYLVVPLILDGLGIGCIALSRREVKPFDESQIALVDTFAAQAVIAIKHARQFRELQVRTEEVRAQADELKVLNSELESRVEAQVGELERMGRLKRFLSPQVADAIVSSGDDKLLSSHRALIAILFCDIRGFTAFCEKAEPEETIEVLQTYHEEMGKLIHAHDAGVDHRSGDGIMVIFNDPLPCDDPAGNALTLAISMRSRMAGLCVDWRKLGHRLGFGVGISLGYATVGVVGSAGRYDYTASGTTVNLASRLCDQASDGEILLSPRAYRAIEDAVVVEPAGELALKGIQSPVEVVRVIRSKNSLPPNHGG
jgi:class 3 adenylate cyclase